MQNLIYAVPAAGVLALLFAWMKASWVSKQDAGDATMVEIAAQIQEGALAFLRAEYRVLSIFVLVVGAILGIAYYGDPARSERIAQEKRVAVEKSRATANQQGELVRAQMLAQRKESAEAIALWQRAFAAGVERLDRLLAGLDGFGQALFRGAVGQLDVIRYYFRKFMAPQIDQRIDEF